MSFLRCFRMDLRRAILSSRFLIATVGYALLLYLNLPTDPWPTDPGYLFALSYKYGFYIFFFLCAAIPYATSFLADTEQNFLQQTLRRTSLASYSVSKCLVTALSGMLSIFLATALFVLYLMIRYSGQEMVQTSYTGWDELMLTENIQVYFAAKALITALIGGSFAVIALNVSVKIRSSCAVMATPVLFYYALNELSAVMLLPFFLHIGVLLNVPAFEGRYLLSMLYFAALSLLILAAGIGLFYLQMRRLRKNGYCT